MKQISELEYRDKLSCISSVKVGEKTEDETIYYAYSKYQADPVGMIKKIKIEYKDSYTYIVKFYWKF